MPDTISIADASAKVGIAPSKWERAGHVRYYFNVPGAAYTLYWRDGKVHFALRKGRSTTAANETAEAILGCNVVERYSRTNGPAAYVVLE